MMIFPEHVRDEVALVTEQQLRCGIFKSPTPAWVLYLMVRKRKQRGRWPCNRSGNTVEFLDERDFREVLKRMQAEGVVRIVDSENVIVAYIPMNERDARAGVAA